MTKTNNTDVSQNRKVILDLVEQYGKVLSLQYGCMHCDPNLQHKGEVSKSTVEHVKRECDEMLTAIDSMIDIQIVQAEGRGYADGCIEVYGG